jgi:nucleotide-binding universal stress UspA family protein
MTTDPLLICYDGSDDAGAAIRRAAELFGERPAIVLALWQSEVAQPDAADERIAEDLAREGASIAEGAGLAATPLWRCTQWRPAAEAIVDAAAEFEAAAVVMGSRGHRGVASVALGSVSTEVLRHSARPVLVAWHGELDVPADRRVVLCYDGSDDAKRAIECAGALLTPVSAIVLVAWQAGFDPFGASAAERAETFAAEGRALARAAGLEAEAATVCATGPLWSTLLQASAERSATAIVVGSRGLSGVKSFLLGSVSENILHHTRRPVLVVRHGSQRPRPVPEEAQLERPIIG